MLENNDRGPGGSEVGPSVSLCLSTSLCGMEAKGTHSLLMVQPKQGPPALSTADLWDALSLPLGGSMRPWKSHVVGSRCNVQA